MTAWLETEIRIHFGGSNTQGLCCRELFRHCSSASWHSDIHATTSVHSKLRERRFCASRVCTKGIRAGRPLCVRCAMAPNLTPRVDPSRGRNQKRSLDNNAVFSVREQGRCVTLGFPNSGYVLKLFNKIEISKQFFSVIIIMEFSCTIKESFVNFI